MPSPPQPASCVEATIRPLRKSPVLWGATVVAMPQRHLAGPLAGTAFVTGAGGTLLFAGVGFVVAIPLFGASTDTRGAGVRPSSSWRPRRRFSWCRRSCWTTCSETMPRCTQDRPMPTHTPSIDSASQVEPAVADPARECHQRTRCARFG